MSAVASQTKASPTSPWTVAAGLAAVFVGLQGLWQLVSLVFFFRGADGGPVDASFLWDVVRDGWGAYLFYLAVTVVGLLVACRPATSAIAAATVWRAVVLYVPVAVAVSFVVGLGAGLLHDRSFWFLGIQVLG